MPALMPELRTTLQDRAEVAGVLQVALVGGVVMIPLDCGPTQMGPHVLALVAPGMAAPVEVQVEMVGVPAPGLYPLRVSLLREEDRAPLGAFVDATPDVPPVAQDGETLEGTGERISLTLDRSDLPSELQQELGGSPRREAEPASSDGREAPTDVRGLADVELDDGAGGPASERPPDSGALAVELPRSLDDGDGALERVQLTGAAATEGQAEESPTAAAAQVDVVVDVTEVEPADGDALTGRVLGNGRYEILEQIGVGGMGSVYLAHHRRLDKRIAVKVLHSSLRRDPTFVERFHREALSASKLDHRNVTQVLDFGEEPDGLLYIVMELLAGVELAEVLDREGALSVERTVQIMAEVCAALAVAHDEGIVHRDIKPANIVLVPHRRDDGTDATLAKVCDFGIAMAQDTGHQDGAAPRRLTKAGMFHGTPAYMSPEQIREGPIDARSDIYACGVLLFEMLTGALPFDSESVADLLMMQLRDEPPPPSVLDPDLGPEVDDVVLQALAKSPDHRQQSARELRGQLVRLLAEADTPAEAEAPPAEAAVSWIDTRHTPAGVDESSADGPAEPDESPMAFDLAGDGAGDTGGPSPRTASFEPAPLDEADSGFAPFAASLAGALGATDVELPPSASGESPAALVGPTLRRVLRGRGELSLLRSDDRTAEQWTVRSGLGESFELQRLVPAADLAGVRAGVGGALAAREVLSMTFREGIADPEIAWLATVLAPPAAAAAPAGDVGEPDRSRPHLLVLTDGGRIGRSRRLTWSVDLCASRLALELQQLCAEGRGGPAESEPRRDRLTLAFRALHTEEAFGLLAHADLIVDVLDPELGWTADRLVEEVVDAFSPALAARVASLALREQQAADPGASAVARTVFEQNARVLQRIAARLAREVTDETLPVLRALQAEGHIPFEGLPRQVQRSIRAEELADRLPSEVEGLLQELQAIDDDRRYAEEIELWEQAMPVLAEREQLTTLWRVVTELARIAGGVLPGDDDRRALAARAARFLADRRVLEPIVGAMMGGAHDQRDAARALLLQAGAPAAAALYEWRREAAPSRGARARFSGIVRDMGRGAVPTVRDALARIDDAGEPAVQALLEDLLRAAPDVPDDELLEQAERFLTHPTTTIRRGAVAVAASAGAEKARAALTEALSDPDETVRVAAVSGLRRLGKIDRGTVEQLLPTLHDQRLGDELRGAAAALLGAADTSAASTAHEALCRALEPPKASLASRLWGSSKSSDSAVFLASVARALLRLDRPGARGAIERRLRTAKGDAREALAELLGRTG